MAAVGGEEAAARRKAKGKAKVVEGGSGGEPSRMVEAVATAAESEHTGRAAPLHTTQHVEPAVPAAEGSSITQQAGPAGASSAGGWRIAGA